MPRTPTIVCLIGLLVTIVTALLLGVPWGALISVLALLACPAAMYLGMWQMAARPATADRSSAHESLKTDGHAGETRKL